MSASILATRQQTLRAVCRSCRRALHGTSRRLQEQSSSPPAPSTSTTAINSPTPAPRSAQTSPDFLDLLNRFTQRSKSFSANSSARIANANAPTAVTSPPRDSNNPTKLYDFVETLSSKQRSRLTPGSSRRPDIAPLGSTSETLRGRSSRRPIKERTHEEREMQTQLRKRLGRQWQAGDVYAPSDLGPREQRKWLKRQTGPTQGDVFEMIGKSPLSFYRNFTVLSEFMSETGRIKPASETGLKRKNQRKMAKTIRRAIGLSIIPSVYKHPHLLKKKVGLLGA